MPDRRQAARAGGPKGPPVRHAISRRLSAYLDLMCGHKTTTEAQEAYRVWRPKGSRKRYCEVCGKWVALTKSEKPPTMPEEPLF